MSQYDLQKAQDHFRSRITFTTGVHELDAIAQRKTDGVVVEGGWERYETKKLPQRSFRH